MKNQPLVARTTLASIIEAFLAEEGITQTELALKAGLSPSVVSRILSGDVKAARFPTIRKLSTVLRVPPKQLISSLESGGEDITPRSTVFLSYSHHDEAWKDCVIKKFPEGVFEIWDDRGISGQDDCLPEIQEAMDRAAVAVLLISTDFLNSKFIQETEIPYLLERHQTESLKIIPVIVNPCPWTEVPWIDPIQCWPKDGNSLADKNGRQIDESLLALTLEIQKHLGAVPQPFAPSTPRFDLGRLPTMGPEFVGRETELDRLDAAWGDSSTHVLTLVAFGGVGKSALVSRWLDRRAAAGWPGVQRAFDWSFYSQGTEERIASADSFLDHALRFLGDSDPGSGSPRDRGLRLAELVRREKTLLVLDGLEPLQHPPGPLAGRLKDPGLAALLKGLAAENPGLCLVTTREHIGELNAFPRTAPQWDLEHLTPKAGAELLRRLAVNGKDSELRDASEGMSGHALALTLLGNYLRRACGGDVRRRREVNLGAADRPQGGHAFRVLEAYSRWLGDGPELAILRLLGFFDRPAEKALLGALRAKIAISGLTDRLVDLSDEEWNWAISCLQEHGLLLPTDPKGGFLDAHPLVRAYFQEELKNQRPEAWRDGNLRLYEHLKNSAPEYPETLEAMEPLFAAIVHGCRAERQREALYEIYWQRILRKDEFYSTKKLGAFGSELTALSGFFDRCWNRPTECIDPADQAFVLNATGFDLSALGRLAEAVQPMQASLEVCISLKNWREAAIRASNLSELSLALGEISRALAFGEQSNELADKSSDAFQRLVNRTTLANALHQAGRLEESAEAFRQAESMQAKNQPEFPQLYSVQGYQYCDLLVSLAMPNDGSGLDALAKSPERMSRFRDACQEVRSRGGQWLAWRMLSDPLLDIALEHLTLGLAHFGLALTAPPPAADFGEEAGAELVRSADHLDRAVDGLRQAGTEDHLPRGLLARASFRRLRGDLAGAQVDLAEALEIADRSSMRLLACDAHLECARLCLKHGSYEEARRHVVLARKLVNETGYGRRALEVRYLESKVGLLKVVAQSALEIDAYVVLHGQAVERPTL